jgi:hypothetical protein
MKYAYLSLLIGVMFWSACSPKINTTILQKYPPLDNTQEVTVYKIGDIVPSHAIVIGTLKIGDSGFSTNCNFEKIMNHAKMQARKLGGNALKITEHRPPNLISSCHRIKADILKIDMPQLKIEEEGLVIKDDSTAPKKSDNHTSPSDLNHKRFLSPFKIGIDGGLSYLIGKIDKTLDPALVSYYKKLKFGYNVGAEAYYFFKDSWGLGLKYCMFRTQNSLDNVQVTSMTTGQTAVGLLEDNIVVHSITPMFSFRFEEPNATQLYYLNIGFGYSAYKNRFTAVNPYTITGSTMNGFMEFGYEFKINNHNGIDVSLSYLSGALSSITIDDGTTQRTIQLEGDNRENISRLNLNIGFKFH